MRTPRTVRWLLISLLSVVVMLPSVRGQSGTDNALIAAAKDDDLTTVQALLAKHANVNDPGADGSTALLWATYHANAEMVRALIAAGATADVANHYGVTPLLQASRTGNTPIIQQLLDAGAKPTRWHADGETPLMAAARAGKVEAVRLLLARGSFVNATDPFQEETALMWAAAEGHLDVVQALLAAGADPNKKAHVNAIEERKHADHASGGFTALMFAVRNGHADVARELVKGGADPKLANADGASATIIAIVNDRFDLASTLLDLGADPNDGSLYFAVDMHDATTDMRAHDGSRLRATHANTLTSLDLVRVLLDRGADANKPFVGQLHSTTLCCGAEINSSPFYRAAMASDVDVLKMMIAHGAKIEWTPTEVKKDGKPAGRGMNANVGKTPLMVALVGGRGAPFAAGPGFDRQGPPPFREASDREPVDAVKVLLQAGADPNVKAPDGSAPLHQAVRARQVAIIRELVGAGAKLDAVNKDNLTPLQVAEGPDPKLTPIEMMMMDPNEYKPKRDTKEAVVAALRELMHLGPNDPTPVPPPPPGETVKKDDKKDDGQGADEKKDDKKIDAKKADVAAANSEKAPEAR